MSKTITSKHQKATAANLLIALLRLRQDQDLEECKTAQNGLSRQYGIVVGQRKGE